MPRDFHDQPQQHPVEPQRGCMQPTPTAPGPWLAWTSPATRPTCSSCWAASRPAATCPARPPIRGAPSPLPSPRGDGPALAAQVAETGPDA